MVEQIGGKTDASLTVSTPAADVTIPNGGLSSLSGTSMMVTITAEKTGNTVELSLTVDGKTVETVSGGLTLTASAENSTPGTVAVLVCEDGTRKVVRKSVADGDSITIPLDGSAKLEIVDNGNQFADVPINNWAADAVAFVSGHELFTGTGGNTFSPDMPMTRGMFAVVLYNLENAPMQTVCGVLADVSGTKWYAKGVDWAASNGIVNGYRDGQFGPNDSITREQLAVMLWRYAGSPTANLELHFTDTDQVSAWAMEALCWAVEKRVLSGYGDGQLGPRELATRAQVAKMLKNFMEIQ